MGNSIGNSKCNKDIQFQLTIQLSILVRFFLPCPRESNTKNFIVLQFTH